MEIYARENGWAITALASLYAATGDQQILQEAVRSADWVTQQRRIAGGGFHHGANDLAGPFLGDSISMARAYLTLYGVTGDRKWLADAESSLRYVDRTFKSRTGAGFVTAVTATDHAYGPHPQRDENVAVALMANLLFRSTGNDTYRKMRAAAMRALGGRPVAQRL